MKKKLYIAKCPYGHWMDGELWENGLWMCHCQNKQCSHNDWYQVKWYPRFERVEVT